MPTANGKRAVVRAAAIGVAAFVEHAIVQLFEWFLERRRRKQGGDA